MFALLSLAGPDHRGAADAARSIAEPQGGRDAPGVTNSGASPLQEAQHELRAEVLGFVGKAAGGVERGGTPPLHACQGILFGWGWQGG